MSTATVPSIEQDCTLYTHEDHEVWGLLYAKRMQELRRTGSRMFLEGANEIGLSQDAVPDLSDVNRRLGPRTGWRAVAVKGFIPASDFFACLAERRFPTTIIVRPKAQIDYLPEPDIFHDVFGHVPLHADPVFADFLQRFGHVATLARSDEETQKMARLFWFTVEFGLIEEENGLKVYGSGLISSAADAGNALSDKCEKRVFDLDSVVNQAFEIDRLQDTLFVIKSFGQLFDAVSEMERLLT